MLNAATLKFDGLDIVVSSMDSSLVSEWLAEMGLRLLQNEGVKGAPPLGAVGMLASCTSEDGRVDRVTPLGDPDVSSKFNRLWYEMAVEYRLFDDAGRFLFAIHGGVEGPDAPPRWVIVQTLADFDIFGAGTRNGLAGFQPGFPEFFMSSLDGRTAMCGTTWAESVGCIVVRDPQLSATLRRHVSGPYMQFDLSPFERREAEVWLKDPKGL
ncbi:hypothetical protein ACWGI9_39520 [Streptomyces sp. NPDC054833]